MEKSRCTEGGEGPMRPRLCKPLFPKVHWVTPAMEGGIANDVCRNC